MQQENLRPHCYFGKDPQVKRTATGYQVHVDNLPSSGKWNYMPTGQ
ncbi:MAG: hypothetical protein ACLS4H_09565 [Streptococcus salivarius]